MIYLLEDDNNIRNFVTYGLNGSGLETKGFERPGEFWQALREEMPELLILDLMLPEEDGLSVLAKLRKSPDTAKLPVMILTARGQEYDKVVGLDSGADDYMTKPFGMMELIARVKALLRRSGANRPDDADREIREGKLVISPAEHTVKAAGREVTLTLKEYELLLLLAENRGRVFTRDAILQRIWGYEFDGESRTVDVHVRTLRVKLGECGRMIETVRGVGYKMGTGAAETDVETGAAKR